jgi:hypothetical protein
MNYKIGDYVRFVNERQEGIITSVIDHQLVGVTIEGDFEITVLASEIVEVNKKEKQITNSHTPETQPPSASQAIANRGIFCAFINDDKVLNLYHLYVINNTDYDLLLNCFTEKTKKFSGVFSDKIKQRSYEKITSCNINDFEKWPTYHFHFLYSYHGEYTPVQPLIIHKEFKNKTFFKSEASAPLIQKKGHVFQLDELTVNAQKIMENAYASRVPERMISLPLREVDLHIEELTENFAEMNSQAILNLQMETFRRNLDAAVVHHYRSIIFIHGIGNGTLRNEIHKQLGKHPDVKTFKDARKDKFGFGATEVILV